MAQLIVVEGPNRGKTFEIEKRATLGNAEGVEIKLDDRRASERQAEIRLVDGGRFEIVNLDPKKNVLVNGEVTKRTKLQHGDWITVAESTLVFSDEAPKKQAPLDIQAIDAGDLYASTVLSRRALFDSADSVIEEFDKGPGIEGAGASASGIIRKTRDRLAVLYRVSTAVSSQLHLPKLLDTILELVFDVFGADRGFILLLDEEDRKLKPMASKVRGLAADAEPVNVDASVSKTIIKEVFTRREAVLSTDAQADDRFAAGMSIVGSSMRSVLCAPFVRDDRVVGVIQLDITSTRQAFTKEDLDLLSAIAMQCAIAIENARAYKKRQEYSRNLIYLGRATQRLSSFLDRDRICKETVKAACSLLGCTKGSIILRREDGKLALVYAIGMQKETVGKIGKDEVGRRFAKHVVETGQPLLIAQMRDLPSELVPANLPEPGRYGSDSFLLVPIQAMGEEAENRGTVIGALCLTDKLSKVPFSGNDQEMALILASQAGIALGNADLYEKATVDNLTKVFVRRYFVQRLDSGMRHSAQAGEPLSLIMTDIDHFKSVNDTYGHQAGDAVLKQVGKILKKVVRPEQTVARYGGEEFAILCPQCNPEIIAKVAERVRAAVEEHVFKLPDGREIKKTTSLGCASLHPGETREQFIERADQALYDAKKTGRNRWIVAGPPGTPPLSGETAPKKAAKHAE